MIMKLKIMGLVFLFGQLAFGSYVVPNGSITNAKLANTAVSTAKIADGAVTTPKLAALGSALSSSSGTFTTTNTSPTQVTNLSVTVTTSGNAVVLSLQPDGSSVTEGISILGTNVSANFLLKRGSSTIATMNYIGTGANSIPTTPLSSIYFVDFPTAGTYTYSFFVNCNAACSLLSVPNARLVAKETY